MKLLASLLCSLVWANASAPGFSEERLARLPAFMAQATDVRGYLGAVTLVALGGETVHWQAVGHQDLARRVPMSRDSIFRIYSMSKPIATVAVLMLMEEGRLALDDAVARHLPEFENLLVLGGGSADALRKPLRPLTIRHLLTHTAGLATSAAVSPAAHQKLQSAEPSAADDLQGFAARVARAPLASDPGQRFEYDGVPIELASHLVEVVSGKTFERFLQERIFAPLKMQDTGFEVPDSQRHRVVDISAMGDQGKLVIAAGRSAVQPGVRLNAYASGAGGLYSTAADYLRFCRMLLNGGELDGQRLLGRKTVELMMLNHLGAINPPHISGLPAEGFGLGGSVLLDVAQRGRPGSVGQFGWSGAASTYFTIDRKEGLIALLLMQHLHRDGSPDLPKISAQFYTLVYQALN